MSRQLDFKDSALYKIVTAHKEGKPVGIYSICSANRFVIEACMYYVKDHNTPILIEATSNQVNQFGGYTGMTPSDFVAYVYEIAVKVGLPSEYAILGGDHLGPNAWQNEAAEVAMAKARDMVRDYVAAGFVKIHLDASMRCADDPGDKHTPLNDEVIAARTADLCSVAEEAYSQNKAKSHAPLYVIGTEVPIPGGAQEAEKSPQITKICDAERTIQITHDAFYAKGLQSAWERVIALVVQPGVEFGDDTVFDYDHDKAKELSAFIEKNNQLVYEAHSTDYQTAKGLQELVKDHFAILKVGPWYTFAFREAVFALEQIEIEWLTGKEGVTLSNLRKTIDEVMLETPVYWKKYYHGDRRYLAYARKYSYSDRSRYYWGQPDIKAALERLINNLTCFPAPLALLNQYLPIQYNAIRAGEIHNNPLELIYHYINEQVTKVYAGACGLE
ncbi:MAG: D-tagatose-bisphosphate aldolase, class II, non-catalytic subunit [Bacteroidota bacterium]